MKKKKVIFICTHNSSRSQMAEGLLRYLYGDICEVYSAGNNPLGVNPFAVKVMEEIGIDISSHKSKHIENFKDMEFDYVITVCDNAKDSCPFLPGGKNYIHVPFDDPSQVDGSYEDKLKAFREIRDKIEQWIKSEFINCILERKDRNGG